MLVIACVAIIVVGPKDLPGMLRGLGKTIGNVKRMANDFQRQFNDALKEAELDEVTDLAKNKTFAPLEDAKNAMNDFTDSINEGVKIDPGAEATEKLKKDQGPVAEEFPDDPAQPETAKKQAAAQTSKAPKKTATRKSTARTPKKTASSGRKPAGTRKTAGRTASTSKSAKSTT